MFYIWLMVVIVLSIIEINTTDLVSIWFILSGILSMILSLFTDNCILQMIVFVVVGIILMFLTKKITKKFIKQNVKTNIDRIIGMNGKVLEEIKPNGIGVVKVDGKIWSATSDKLIKKDEVVKIMEINSTKLIVKKEGE